MVLVFFICAIVIIITLLITMTVLSTIRFKVEKFELNNLKNETLSISCNYKLVFSLYLFNKIKWISIKLNKDKVTKIYKKMKIDRFDFKKLEQNFKFEDLKQLKTLDPKISYLNFLVKVGVEDTILTTFIIFVISTIISILLPYTIKKYEKDKYYYQILPLYINKNVYEIKLDCIIEVKMVHIINIIYVFLKKRRVDSNEQRASNRRTYGYSYE